MSNRPEKRGVTRTRRRFAGTVIGVLALCLPLMGAACDPQGRSAVHITYRQLGACSFAPVPPGSDTGGGTFASAGSAFVVYGAIVVQNTGQNPADFDFDPERLFIQGAPSSNVSNSLGVLRAWDNQVVRARLVRAGTTETFTGVSVAVLFGLGAADAPRQVAAERHNLLYDNTEGAQGTLTVNVGPPGESSVSPGDPDCTKVRSSP